MFCCWLWPGMCRLLPCGVPSDPGTGLAPRQPGTLHRARSLVPAGTSPTSWPGAQAGSLLHFLHADFTHSGTGGHLGFPKAWAQPISLQYSLSLVLSGDCGADAPCLPPPGKALGSLAMLYFKKAPLHPQIAWEMVNACRNNAYKEEQVFTVDWNHHWGVCPRLTKTVPPLCQALRSLRKSLFWCLP